MCWTGTGTLTLLQRSGANRMRSSTSARPHLKLPHLALALKPGIAKASPSALERLLKAEILSLDMKEACIDALRCL